MYSRVEMRNKYNELLVIGYDVVRGKLSEPENLSVRDINNLMKTVADVIRLLKEPDPSEDRSGEMLAPVDF